jgi:hypothetical protein
MLRPVTRAADPIWSVRFITGVACKTSVNPGVRSRVKGRPQGLLVSNGDRVGGLQERPNGGPTPLHALLAAVHGESYDWSSHKLGDSIHKNRGKPG